MTKDVCGLCQNKLEFCRQYFEQIYNAHVKLLGFLREEEPSDLSFEEQILHFVRSYDDGIDKFTGDNRTRELVKCEPEIDLREVNEGKEMKRDSKHFLDDLLDEYDNTLGTNDLRSNKKLVGELGRKKKVKKKKIFEV